MLLVMTDHAGFMALGVPTKELTATNPILSLLVFSDMSISIICVNTFVLLSGWFGIKWHPRKLMSLIFQVLFFALLVFIIMCVYKPDKYLNLNSFTTVFLFHSNDYWFIKSYILLFLLAPMINNFIENSQEKDLRIFIIAFYLIQTIYAWLSINGAGDFVGGYSALSFIGLYTLARYVKTILGKPFFKNWSFRNFFTVFITIAIAQTVIAFGVTKYGLPVAGRLFTYTNPLVIIQALALVLAFTKIGTFYNRTINWISSSCLAVYLLHANELVLREYYMLNS